MPRHATLCAACLLRLGLGSDALESAQSDQEVRLLGPIGRGPHGIVYLGCYDDDPRRFVTVKVIEQHIDVDAFVGLMGQIIDRIEHQGRSRSGQLLNAGVMSDGRAFVRARYAPGRRLDQFFEAKDDDRDLLDVLASMCHLIADLHSRGIVHGSVKMQNLIVAATSNGPHAALLDAGIRPAIEASSILARPAHPIQLDEVFGGSRRASDVVGLEGLVANALRGHADSAICRQLARRLRTSRYTSAAELGHELHSAAAQANA